MDDYRYMVVDVKAKKPVARFVEQADALGYRNMLWKRELVVVDLLELGKREAEQALK